jgi:aryl-alcohol dehydrogenase-like predicted oxidoreductase
MRTVQVLNTVAEKHRVTVSAVAARWVLQQPQVAAIILGARNALHYRVSC